MPSIDARFATDIAGAYARWLVPLLFEPYARVLSARIAALAPKDVLETAAGTGVLTQSLASALPAAHIVATDLNVPMLDVGRSAIRASQIDWRMADAQALPFPDDAFDVVACQFGVMFFADRVAAHREARRVLRAGGRLVFAVWDRLDANPLPCEVTASLATRFPNDPPRFMARTPHGYHDADRIAADLRAAGFGDVAIEPVAARSRAANARDAATAFCAGTPLRHEIEARDPGGLGGAIDQVTTAIEARYGSGAIDVPMRAILVEARA